MKFNIGIKMKIDFEELDSKEIYKIISHNIIPRPIAWIITHDEEDDILNIAPFSYFTPLSSNPPCVVVSIGHKDDGIPKDTLVNIRKYHKCTICLVEEDNLKKMHYSSKSLPKNISECEEYDIKTEKKFDDYPPMVKDTGCAFFCEFMQEIDLDGSSTRPMILKIKHAYIDKKDDENPICRVGKSYAKIGDKLEAPEIK